MSDRFTDRSGTQPFLRIRLLLIWCWHYVGAIKTSFAGYTVFEAFDCSRLLSYGAWFGMYIFPCWFCIVESLSYHISGPATAAAGGKLGTRVSRVGQAMRLFHLSESNMRGVLSRQSISELITAISWIKEKHNDLFSVRNHTPVQVKFCYFFFLGYFAIRRVSALQIYAIIEKSLDPGGGEATHKEKMRFSKYPFLNYFLLSEDGNRPYLPGSGSGATNKWGWSVS